MSVLVILFMTFVLLIETKTLINFDGDNINSYIEHLRLSDIEDVSMDETNFQILFYMLNNTNPDSFI